MVNSKVWFSKCLVPKTSVNFYINSRSLFSPWWPLPPWPKDKEDKTADLITEITTEITTTEITGHKVTTKIQSFPMGSEPPPPMQETEMGMRSILDATELFVCPRPIFAPSGNKNVSLNPSHQSNKVHFCFCSRPFYFWWQKLLDFMGQ